jgi:hypothetical protein
MRHFGAGKEKNTLTGNLRGFHIEILVEAANFMGIDSCDGGITNSYPA